MSSPGDQFMSRPCIDDYNLKLKNGVEITFTNEEVQDIEADVVVVGNSPNFCGADTAAQCLVQAGGAQYERALDDLRKKRAGGQVVLRCEAGKKLKCKKVYHAIMDVILTKGPEWKGRLQERYEKSRSMAQEDEAKVVAAVLIGAGKAGGPTADSVRAALAAFSSLPASGSSSSSLQRLLLVERDERKTREAIQECEAWAKENPSLVQLE